MPDEVNPEEAGTVEAVTPEEIVIDADCDGCDDEPAAAGAVIELDEDEFLTRVAASLDIEGRVNAAVEARLASLEVPAEVPVEEVEVVTAAAGDSPSAPVQTPTVPLATRAEVEALQERLGAVEDRLNQLQAIVLAA